MAKPEHTQILQLAAADVPRMHDLLTMFGDAFDDVVSYGARRRRQTVAP